ncbi:PadR family transcriptional regulator [Metabacillus herbersteinensis]|uniref:PadR family transcriptional regulator n=1 Tax=Metabacillus herbersteinensis TaxID=283816 RepID=A0ABV6G9X4_9BACI
MENRLNELRKSMKNSPFNELEFNDQHRKNILEKIHKVEEKDEDIFFSVMQLLTHEKTGFELAKSLRSRGIKRFEDNEGFLYTLLHRLEKTGYIKSSWDDNGAKHYQLTNKGTKILQKAESKQSRKHLVLKELLEG